MLHLNLKTLNKNFCVATSGKEISSEEFLSLVHAVSLQLQSKPLRLALSFEDSYFFAIAVFAALAAGKKVIILQNLRPATLENFKSEFDEVLTDQFFDGLQSSTLQSDLFIPGEAELIFFTSGSSGEPKKIKKSFENFYREVEVLEKTFSDKIPGRFFLATVTHQHIYGFLFKVLWPVCCGHTWAAATVEYPEQIPFFSQKQSSFALISTPAFLKRYFLPDVEVKNCDAIFSSGGPLDFASSQTMKQALGVAPIEVYGSTESGGIAFRQRSEEDQPWIPFSVVQVSLTESGQLRIQSPYFDEAHLDLGDRAERHGAGFRLLGRVDDIVKIEEKRISLSEINSKILISGWVQESLTTALDISGRQQLVCLAVLNEKGRAFLESQGHRAICSEINVTLKPHFESVVLPKKYRFVDRLPYNEQSKIVKSDLLEYFNGYQ